MNRCGSVVRSSLLLHLPVMLLAALWASACIPDYGVSSGEGGAGAGGGGGAGAGPTCEPMAELACYSGIAGTADLGICTAGVKVCDAAGPDYGPCEGSGSPKVEDCSSPEDENCDGHPGCAGECLWTRRFAKREYGNGGELSKFGLGGIAVDESWNTIVVGSYNGSLTEPGPIDFGEGPLSCTGSQCGFVAKLDPLGNHLWSKPLDGYLADAVSTFGNGDIVLASQGGGPESFVCGVGGSSFYSTIVAVLDPDGNCKPDRPATKLEVKPGSVPRIAVGNEGAVYATFHVESGKIGGTSYGGQSILVRIELGGQVGWVEPFGGFNTRPVALTVDSAGDVFITGDMSNGTAKFGPNLALSPSYEDVFVARFRPSQRASPNGPWAWARQMNVQVTKGAYAADIVTDGDGAVFIAGALSAKIAPGDKCGELEPGANGSNLFVAQLKSETSEAPCQRVRAFGQLNGNGWDLDFYFRMRIDADDKHLLLAGRYDDASLLFPGGPWESVPITPGGDIFVAKLKTASVDALEPIWVRGFGGPYSSYPYGLAVDSGGGIRLSGSGSGVDFGCGPGDNIKENFFITRLSP